MEPTAPLCDRNVPVKYSLRQDGDCDRVDTHVDLFPGYLIADEHAASKHV